jgi:H-type lectin domain-containing protein
MKKLRNHLIGVDQGTKILFSDFEDGGDMWTGKGSRSRAISVNFSNEFKAIPMVHVSLDMWDMDQKTNQRADISAENITTTGFEVVFKTWGDTKIARVRAAWFAIGEFTGEDEWELY